MLVTAGSRLGPYEILSRVGAGGMGEVYKAQDTRLDRTVAIKVLAPDLASDPAARQRLEREARAIAALQHPHICTLHDIGHQDGTDFLVMEYLEGETLAQRLAKGKLPLEQAIQHAIQVAEGLATAHRAGIIHRDLKPGNIMLTRSGAKLLDFGLAKPQTAIVATGVTDVTTQGPITRAGVILGTLQYMAQEQLEGNQVDARTDVFAFGLVLYEMLAGRRAFPGNSSAAVASAILTAEPSSLDDVVPAVPLATRELVRACLVKDRDERWQSAADLACALRWDGRTTAGLRPALRRELSTGVVLGILAGLAVVAAALLLWPGLPANQRLASAPARFEILIPPEQRVVDGPVISGDGKGVAYTAIGGDGRHRVYLRRLDELETKPVPGTEDARYPFFSPDGRTIGFFGEGALRAVSLADGSVTTVVTGLGRYPAVARGASWGTDGAVVFAPLSFSGLQRVSRPGDPIEPLTGLEVESREGRHLWPEQLPEGRGVLFTTNSPNTLEPFKVRIRAPGEALHRDVIDAARSAKYVAGHLIFARGSSLLAVPFDVESGHVVGTPRLLLEGVRGDRVSGHSFFAVSAAGTLVYADGPDVRELSTPVILDESGTQQALQNAPEANYIDPTISPDSNRAIISAFTDVSQDLWLYDFTRRTWTRLTRSMTARMAPLWLDGEWFVFSAETAGNIDLWRGTADESRESELLVRSSHAKYAMSWSAASRLLAFVEVANGTNEDIWLVDMSGTPKPEVFLATPFRESSPDLSPDGHWLAYESDESGRNEVYVRPVRRAGGKSQVSTTGGRWPRWSRDGRRLFYMDGDRLMAVPVTVTSAAFRAGQPTLRLQYPYYGGSAPNYATLANNGLLLMRRQPPARLTRFIVVQDWMSELEKLTPER